MGELGSVGAAVLGFQIAGSLFFDAMGGGQYRSGADHCTAADVGVAETEKSFGGDAD